MTDYHITAWCDRTCYATFDVEAASPEQALELARQQVHDEPAEECDNRYDWDQFRICDTEGNELLAFPPAPGPRDLSPAGSEDTGRMGEVASELLDALTISEGIVQWAFDHGADPKATAAALRFIGTVVAKATAVLLPPAPDATSAPSRFAIEHDREKHPERVHVRVDETFDVAIVRTDEGIVVEVYPTEWDSPIDTMTVWDEQVAELEKEWQKS